MLKSKNILILNFLIFVIILSGVCFHYYLHFQNLKKEIFSLIKNEAVSIAERFQISASKLYSSNEFIKSIIKGNLHSQTQFIDLLNSIEEFKNEELKEFAKETNLKLIFIVSFDFKKIVSYSKQKGLLKNIKNILKKNKYNKLFFDKKNNIIFYVYRGKYSKSFIITGLNAKKYFETQEKITTDNLIKSIIKARKEILNIKICKLKTNSMSIKLVNNRYFEVILPFNGKANKSIKILIDATNGVKIINDFKHNLLVFIIVIFLTGIIVNLLLYKIQKNYIFSLQQYEKKLYQREKEAALGRSAALIAHEIRNPINAISMGIQRIQYETLLTENEEYEMLLNTIKRELNRINKTIETFIDYTKPLNLKKEKINLYKIINEISLLFKRDKINIIIDIPDNVEILADKNLIIQAFGNLIKNGVENKNTSYLKITLSEDTLIFENNGLDKKLDTEKIFEPYYTDKVKGSGLGLAIVKKIVEAHNWKIFCKVERDVVKFLIILDK